MDSNRPRHDGGVSVVMSEDEENDVFHKTSKPNLDMLRRWRKATLVLNGSRRFRYAKDVRNVIVDELKKAEPVIVDVQGESKRAEPVIVDVKGEPKKARLVIAKCKGAIRALLAVQRFQIIVRDPQADAPQQPGQKATLVLNGSRRFRYPRDVRNVIVEVTDESHVEVNDELTKAEPVIVDVQGESKSAEPVIVDVKGESKKARLVIAKCKRVIHALRAVQRFQIIVRDPQADAPQQPGQEATASATPIDQRTDSVAPPAPSSTTKVVLWILYKRPYRTSPGENPYPVSDMFCAALYVCFVLTVFIIASYSKVVPWPVESHSYITEYLPENTGGAVITCDSYLESAKNPESKTTRNMCFQANKLETVTMVMSSDPTAKALMDEKIEEVSSMRPITKMLEGGFSVTEEAYGLNDLVNSTIHEQLPPLFPGGYNQDFNVNIKYLIDLIGFPEETEYLRVSLVYDCNNCISCSLAVVRNLRRIVDSTNEASWVSCSYYGGLSNKCRSENRYTGKCELYQPEKLSATFAIWNFLIEFFNLSGIRNIRAFGNAERQKVKFEPSVLYLNISHALSSSIMLGFMEVNRASATWTMFSNSFPTLKDCTKLPRVRVCNGTSVCSMFKNAGSDELRCLDLRNHTHCKLMLQYGVDVPDHLINKGERPGKIVCPTSFTCMEKAPYFVVRKIPQGLENSALNSFVGSRKLSEEWARSSGVCTNTYKNVIRYHPSTGEGAPNADEEVTLLLESKCTKEEPTQPSYCVPTGRYHTPSDNPGADWKDLGNDFALAISTRVTLKTEKRKGFGEWYIDFSGYVLGWTGSAILVSEFVFIVFDLARPFCFGVLKSAVKSLPRFPKKEKSAVNSVDNSAGDQEMSDIT